MDIRKIIEYQFFIIALLLYKLTTSVILVQLVLNHLIILFNVFNEAAVPLLFYNLEEDLWPSIKSFLVFLNRIPEYPKTRITELEPDQNCLDQLNTV